MKKLSKFFCALILATLIFVANPLSAKDLNGKFGVGYDQTLGGVSGINLKYWIENVGIWGTIGLKFASPDVGDTGMVLNFALRGIYNFARSELANLGIGLGVDLGFANKAMMKGADSSFQFNAEIPLVAEFFFSDHFAVHIATGLTVVIVPEKGLVLIDNDGLGALAGPKGFGVGFGTGGRFLGGLSGGLFGSAGFTFYF